MARTRSRTEMSPGGKSWKNSNTPISQVPVVLSQGTCHDSVGYPTDHSLDILSRSRLDCLANGTNGKLGVGRRSVENYVPAYLRTSLPYADSAGFFPISSPTAESAAVTAAARSNPSRPAVNLPLAVAELKDLPQTVKSIGDLIRSSKGRGRSGMDIPYKLGSANLTWSFGIAPLISDVKRLFLFQKAVDNKIKELRNLRDKGGIRRRVKLHSDQTSTTQTGINFESNMWSALNAVRTTTFLIDQWATIRWRPNDLTSLPRDEAELRSKAARLVLGLEADSLYTTAWNLVPWSWMTDWFVNVGDYLEAQNHSVHSTCEKINIMTHYRAYATFTNINKPSWVTGLDECTLASEWKMRRIFTSLPGITASVPLIEGHRLGILASLAVTRGKRR
jgi:hypothetical protein